MDVIPVTYDSANYYLIKTTRGWLMVDTGWAGTMPTLLSLLRRRGIDPKDIRHLCITHFHPDHAGLAQDIKDLGATLILHECQVPYVSQLKRYFKPHHRFREIGAAGNVVLSSEGSRTFFAAVGLTGELVPTPGHSDDSISIVFDGCCAFTGDLPFPSFIDPATNAEAIASWAAIRNHQVRTVYPTHSSPVDL